MTPLREYWYKNWKLVLLLSIIVPVGLLTSFILAGIIREPPKLENVTLDVAAWEFRRPNIEINIDERLNATYSTPELWALMVVDVGAFHQDPLISDCITLGVAISSMAANSKCFIESINIIFRENYTSSCILWDTTSFCSENLSITDLDGVFKKDPVKAYVELINSNHSAWVHLQTMAFWELQSSHDQSHELEAVVELAYYNGVTRKKVTQSFDLKIIGQ